MGRGLTITAFVLSLLFLIPLAPIAGLILGIVAYNKAKNDPGALKELAIAAIIIGAVFGLINAFFTLGLVMGFVRGMAGM